MLFKWTEGRQSSGYRKFTFLYSKKLKMDGYLIDYPTNSFIPEHKDTVECGKLYRLNIVIWKSKKGGEFKADEVIWSWRDRIHLFQADASPHSVSTVTEGKRYVLSFGIIWD